MAVNTELYFIVSAVFAVVSVLLLLAFKTYKEKKAEYRAPIGFGAIGIPFCRVNARG